MPGWTKTPNAIFDAMPEMSEAELKITMALVRATYGVHSERCALTYNDLSAATGMTSRASVSKGVKAVLARGFFAQEDGRSAYTTVYRAEPKTAQRDDLNSSHSELNDGPNSSHFELNDGPNSSHFEPKTVHILNQNSSHFEPSTIYKEKEEKRRRGGREKTPLPTTAVPDLLLAEMVNALAEVTLLDGHLNFPVLSQLASELIPAYTPDQLRCHYAPGQSPNGHWNWYLHDWRGQRNDTPRPKEIRETVKKAVAGIIPRPKAAKSAEKAPPPDVGLKPIADGLY